MKISNNSGSVSSDVKICFLLSLAAFQVCTIGCSMQQRRFSSPEDAVNAWIAAAKSENTEEVRRILGKGADDVISSGDAVADQQARETFLRAYYQKHALVSEPDGRMTLLVGMENWPMPIPIVERRGSWRFDTEQGKEELLNRRIGRNELNVQQVCMALVDAQKEYQSADRNGDGVLEYAQMLLSDPGQRNGLYWDAGPDEPPSPMGPLVAEAAAEGYTRNESGQRRPYHGYFYKLLRSQGSHAPGGARDYMANGKMTGGFAIVAWPAEYGNSGVMAFLVSHQGVVYERDLGHRTDEIANSMISFDPDPQWDIATLRIGE